MLRRRRVVAGLLALTIAGTSLYGSRMVAQATSSSELQEEQEQAKEELEEMEAAKAALEEALGDMNSDLYDLSDSLTDLEDAIAAKEAEIEEAEEALALAQTVAAQQYSDMKLRIQYMYESNVGDGWSYIFAAESIADFLNRAVYITDLTEYDRQMLEDYNETIASIEAYQAELEEDYAELLAYQEDLGDQQTALLSSIASQQASISDAEDAIDDQEQVIADYDEKIQAMIAYEEALRKAEEEAAKKRDLAAEGQAQRDASASTWGQAVTAAEGEEELLAALIYCEAGNSSYDCMLAVGSVVLNRVNSPYYPDTITGVIYQSGQFSPAASGRLALVLENGKTTDAARQAAAEVLSGTRTGDWLHFHYNNGSISGDVIGSEVFY